MGRGPKPAKSKEAKPPARKSPKEADSRVRDLEKQLAAAQEQLQTRDRELVEALEQQTATSEILRVISSSPTDVQPVFEAIVDSAMRLCETDDVHLNLVEGDHCRRVMHRGPIATVATGSLWPIRGFIAGRAVIECRTIHIADVMELDESEYPNTHEMARRWGTRTALAVPLLREGSAIGVIVLRRGEVRPFSDRQLALLHAFADQAVIAIENVRLFNETREALERQTATSEILKVIAASPTDLQPVLDAVAERAARLCGADDANIHLVEGELLRLRAKRGPIPTDDTRPIVRTRHMGRVVLERRTIHLPDIQVAVDEFPDAPLTMGVHTALATPLLREGVAIGVINIRRLVVEPFSEKQIALLETFADQAVIAIENVRLFKELQEKNQALTQAHAQVTEALDQQTATAEILKIISRSPTDVQPVFDAIVISARRLLQGYSAGLTRVVGDQIELVALTSTDDSGDTALRARFPLSLPSDDPHSQAIRDRAAFNSTDFEADPRVPEAWRVIGRARGWRSGLVVPMLRHEEALGTIAVTRREPGGFTDDEIALLQTFGDQAVIAIENVRLFSELQARTEDLTRSVGELTALGAVGQALSSTLDVDIVLDTIVTRANDLIGADGCTIFEYDEAAEQFHLRATRNLEPRLVELARGTPLRRGDQGILGRLPSERQPVQVPDITVGSYSSPISAALIEAGYRAVVAVPLIREDHLIGALTMNRKTPGEFPPETIDLLKTFATQSALAIQNARLFREIADKSRQLEVASQHKSEFLANMSHELRTPLNAIIGFSEVLSERMFGDLNEKQEEYLKDIYTSGTHLLSLINDILDLSKIEAGRMELELTDFDLPQAIDNALILVRERAGRRGITLEHSVDERLGEIRGDERKVKQVLLNLLSNALKFTPEGGRVEVRAGMVDGMAEISVTDTGVGIAPEDQESVFEEFRQVGTAEKKAEGTGLGLTLCRKFVELHGGKIWVKTQLGVGSTFTFTILVRRDG